MFRKAIRVESGSSGKGTCRQRRDQPDRRTDLVSGLHVALAITAWACLVPLAAAFALTFRLPMQAREEI
jgi:hypothetical protein